MKQDQIFAYGTVRQNRSRLPNNSKNKKTDQKMEVGEYEFKTQISAESNGWIKKLFISYRIILNLSEVTTVNHRQRGFSKIDS